MIPNRPRLHENAMLVMLKLQERNLFLIMYMLIVPNVTMLPRITNIAQEIISPVNLKRVNFAVSVIHSRPMTLRVYLKLLWKTTTVDMFVGNVIIPIYRRLADEKSSKRKRK
jgi:hypothetical protein